MTTQTEKAQTLARLHAAPEILRVVNVWDVVSAKTIAALPETKRPRDRGPLDRRDLRLRRRREDPARPHARHGAPHRRIATDLPVSADLDAGFGDPGETVRRAIGAGVVGANMEDRLRPLAESVAAVEAVDRRGGGGGSAVRAQCPHRRLRARGRPAGRGVDRRRDRRGDVPISTPAPTWSSCPAS